jgi:nucleoside-diphosphate kinase
MPAKDLEQTLVLIKPDALKNSLTGYVLSLLSEFHTGLRFAGTRIVTVSQMLAEEHYAEHQGKVFFPSLIEYITGLSHYPDMPGRRRVIAIVYQGDGAIQKVRGISGPTNPLQAREQNPGCIRSLGTLVPLVDGEGNTIGQRMDNLIHASANPADAEREVKLWFKPGDIPPAMRAYATRQSDEHYYYAEGRIQTEHVPGSLLLLAPGGVAWDTDLEVLECCRAGKTPPRTIESVAAKYTVND